MLSSKQSPIPFNANASAPHVDLNSYVVIPSPTEHKHLSQTENVDDVNRTPQDIEVAHEQHAVHVAMEDNEQQHSHQPSPSGSTNSSVDETQFKMSPDQSPKLHGETDPTQHVSDAESSPDNLTAMDDSTDVVGQEQQAADEQVPGSLPTGSVSESEQTSQAGISKKFSKRLVKRIYRDDINDILVARRGKSTKRLTYKLVIDLEKSKIEVEFVIHVKHVTNLKLEACFKFPQDGKAKQNFQREVRQLLICNKIVIRAQIEVFDSSKQCILHEMQYKHLTLDPTSNSLDNTPVLTIPNVVPYGEINSSESTYIEFNMEASIELICNPEPVHLSIEVNDDDDDYVNLVYKKN